MLPAPLWLSLLFDGCTCHFGFLVQASFDKRRRFKWHREVFFAFISPCCSTGASVIAVSCSKLRYADVAELLLLPPPTW